MACSHKGKRRDRLRPRPGLHPRHVECSQKVKGTSWPLNSSPVELFCWEREESSLPREAPADAGFWDAHRLARPVPVGTGLAEESERLPILAFTYPRDTKFERACGKRQSCSRRGKEDNQRQEKQLNQRSAKTKIFLLLFPRYCRYTWWLRPEKVNELKPQSKNSKRKRDREELDGRT